jgi:hypothetical protein
MALALLLGVGCGSEDAIPIDPANPPTPSDGAELETPDVSHPIEPTEQMQDIARQQCLDDPEREQGYVRAVDPESGEVFAEFTVDCAEVRAE